MKGQLFYIYLNRYNTMLKNTVKSFSKLEKQADYDGIPRTTWEDA